LTSTLLQKLQNDTPVKVDTLRIDLAHLGSIPNVLKKLDSLTKGVDVEVVFFNAARIKPTEVLSASVEEIDEDTKVLSSFCKQSPYHVDCLLTTNLALYVISHTTFQK
jgi:short-subunit dehydrogenase